MVPKLNLGYPEITVTTNSGRFLHTAWFWGKRGNGCEPYSRWTDKLFEELQKYGFRNVHLDEAMVDMLETELKLDFCRLEPEFFNQQNYKDFISQGDRFLVPISITSFVPDCLRYLEKTGTVLPKDLLNYIRNGGARVLFFSLKEGTVRKADLEIVQRFCRNNNLGREHVAVASANLNTDIVNTVSGERLFEYVPVNFFGEDLWFVCQPKSCFEGQFLAAKDRERYLTQNFLQPKQHRVLNLNRRKTCARIFISSFIRSLGKNDLVSQGIGYEFLGEDGINGLAFLKTIADSNFSTSRYFNRVEAFLKDIGTKNITVSLESFDEGPMYKDRGIGLPERAYRTSFVSVVSETFFDEEPDILFITEKTYKSIYTCQPFIILSTPGTLRKLQSIGYKTFNRWWDESYDLIEDPVKRMDAVCDLILSIEQKSFEELHRITQEMAPVLEYNNKLLNSSRGIFDIIKKFRFLYGG